VLSSSSLGPDGKPRQSKPLRHRFNAHANVCAGIAFSPVNNLLLCSAGYDNRIYFFDIVEGKEVKKIDCGTALSSISFCADGHTIGVGTYSGGRVIIYDLKEAKKIKIELKGHDASKRITYLNFSKLAKSTSSATGPQSVASSQASVRGQPPQFRQKKSRSPPNDRNQRTTGQRTHSGVRGGADVSQGN
jgi:WD40 repeat protein